ncbi:hypothetical protein [Dysgonomonas sp. 511]|uniref:hypothetical protein n=1 Tax=Dysgonomonas sp. 511 TaxID=2302930 RepID=UPI0013D6495F|nr:hypothetical protein [Dysgonomonas sp. 511]NDV78468.1 hypothetical protein [Dysgonomonas sp. 511]
MKKKIKDLLKVKLEILGYKFLEKKRNKNDIIFYKELDNGMVLSLAIERSRLYSNTFTCSFYMAVSYTWPLHTPEFLPSEAYQRIGSLLDLSQKKVLSSREYWYVNDLWWKIDIIEELDVFFDAIKIADKKFITENKNLLSIIQKSGKYKEYITYIKVLFSILEGFRKKNCSKEDSLNEVREITQNVVREKNDIRNNKNGIILLSLDAFNCFYLSSTRNWALIEDTARIDINNMPN